VVLQNQCNIDVYLHYNPSAEASLWCRLMLVLR